MYVLFVLFIWKVNFKNEKQLIVPCTIQECDNVIMFQQFIQFPLYFLPSGRLWEDTVNKEDFKL